MTSEELQAIKARLQAASDGPWSVRRIPNSYESQAGDRYTHPCVRGFRVPRRLYNLAWEQCEADAEFMAQARQDVPALVEEVEQLRAMLHDCRLALEEVLANKGPVSPDDILRIEEFLGEQEARFEGRAARKGGRMQVAPPMRPKDAVAALTNTRKAG